MTLSGGKLCLNPDKLENRKAWVVLKLGENDMIVITLDFHTWVTSKAPKLF